MYFAAVGFLNVAKTPVSAMYIAQLSTVYVKNKSASSIDNTGLHYLCKAQIYLLH
jgi:hypothetical protein